MSGAAEQGWRLYADVGNTALKWAARAEGEWAARGRLDVAQLRLEPSAIARELRAADLAPEECGAAILVASRPSLADRTVAALAEVPGAPVLLMGCELQSALEIDYQDAAEIGQDRIAAAEGALALHGAPAIVLTLGTCITAQALDGDRRLLGGAIAAGLQAQVAGICDAVPHLREPVERALALARGGGSLPAVGRSTVENLAAGLRTSLCGTATAMIAAMHERVGDAPVVATGGDAELARAAGAQFDRIEPLLVLEGLRALHERAADGR